MPLFQGISLKFYNFIIAFFVKISFYHYSFFFILFVVAAFQKQQQYETNRPPPPSNPPPQKHLLKEEKSETPVVKSKEKAPEPFLAPKGIEIPDDIELVRKKQIS